MDRLGILYGAVELGEVQIKGGMSQLQRRDLKDALMRAGCEHVMMVVGGVIPQQDFQQLYDSGAAAIFPPGTNIPHAAEKLLHELNIRLGYAQRDATVLK